MVLNLQKNQEAYDPKRLFKAYSQSASTIKFIKSFCHGGFADLKKVHLWNLGYIKKVRKLKSLKN